MNGPAADTATCVVSVCRGCCCGNAELRPGIDHDALLTDLGKRLGADGKVRVTGCLWVCGDANVVVVSPRPEARRTGARPVWLAQVDHPDVSALIAAWVAAGGPGLAPMPRALRPHLSRPFEHPDAPVRRARA
ncbi:MAG: (2Fe-2S) ferredoxin domain-containing protein [Nocardioides sp.]|uniref:(2Fe-2S) ferredoxin domain-containing protein n=1 Tax=Nocardioides sp. TaxID=35761 RepID=UPI0039E4A6B0